MANLPWFLIGIGIVFVIVGSVLVVISSQSGPLKKKERRPEARRSHQEIRELLEDKGNPIPAPTVVMIVGGLLILAGFAWRSFRDFR